MQLHKWFLMNVKHFAFHYLAPAIAKHMHYKEELKHGFWMALTLFFWWVAEYLIGLQGSHIQYLQISVLTSNLLILLVGAWLVLHRISTQPAHPVTGYWNLALSACITVLAMAILSLGLANVFYRIVHPDWTEFMAQTNLARVPPGSTHTPKIESLRAMYSPGSMGMMAFSRLITLGLMVCLPLAYVQLLINKRSRA